jgi:hypothetical protein
VVPIAIPKHVWVFDPLCPLAVLITEMLRESFNAIALGDQKRLCLQAVEGVI